MHCRRVAWLLLALPLAPGCTHFTHGTDDCVLRPRTPCPEESKACVYVFLFDTYNPLSSGNLVGLRDHLHEMGFGKTYYGWPHHVDHFLAELQLVQAERPNARFAVVGFHRGATAARQFAAAASESGIMLDLAVYLEPGGLLAWEEAEALHTFTIRAPDLIGHEGGPAHVSKSMVPTHPMTLDILERELTLLAMGVPPPPRRPPVRVNLVAPMPPPRETIPIPKELPPEWQYLRPRHPWETPPPPPVQGGETLPYPRVVPELPPPREVK